MALSFSMNWRNSRAPIKSATQKFFSRSRFHSSASVMRFNVRSQYATCASGMPLGPITPRHCATTTS